MLYGDSQLASILLIDILPTDITNLEKWHAEDNATEPITLSPGIM